MHSIYFGYCFVEIIVSQRHGDNETASVWCNFSYYYPIWCRVTNCREAESRMRRRRVPPPKAETKSAGGLGRAQAPQEIFENRGQNWHSGRCLLPKKGSEFYSQQEFPLIVLYNTAIRLLSEFKTRQTLCQIWVWSSSLKKKCSVLNKLAEIFYFAEK